MRVIRLSFFNLVLSNKHSIILTFWCILYFLSSLISFFFLTPIYISLSLFCIQFLIWTFNKFLFSFTALLISFFAKLYFNFLSLSFCLNLLVQPPTFLDFQTTPFRFSTTLPNDFDTPFYKTSLSSSIDQFSVSNILCSDKLSLSPPKFYHLIFGTLPQLILILLL